MAACDQVKTASQAAVVYGVHGAHLANAFFQHDDATLVEIVPTTVSIPSEDEEAVTPRDGIFSPGVAQVYGWQWSAGARQYMTARLVDVINNPGCNGVSNWMYRRECKLRMNLTRLQDSFTVVEAMHNRRR